MRNPARADAALGIGIGAASIYFWGRILGWWNYPASRTIHERRARA